MNGRAEVSRLRKRLDATFGRMPSSTIDAEIQADYAKYLCVLVSGFLENSIVALLLHYVEKRSAPEVAAFVERELDRWTNPNVEKILQLFGSFNNEWRDTLCAYIVDQRKDSINSIVALRHKIAHGESVGTTLYQVKVHYAVILDVVDFLAELVDP